MPYIKQSQRPTLDGPILELIPEDEGELNYVITKIVQSYIARKGLRYVHINAAVGALECAKLELYRRIAAPYENQKIGENGDVIEDALSLRLIN